MTAAAAGGWALLLLLLLLILLLILFFLLLILLILMLATTQDIGSHGPLVISFFDTESIQSAKYIVFLRVPTQFLNCLLGVTQFHPNTKRTILIKEIAPRLQLLLF